MGCRGVFQNGSGGLRVGASMQFRRLHPSFTRSDDV